MTRRHVVVVGGGIAGLAAALRLGQAGHRVTLLEGSPRLGGKLRTGELAGLPVEHGAESLLARAPEAIALAREVGLGDDLVHPATGQASLWTRGTLRPIPAGTVMGVPGDLRALERSGVLSPAGLLRVPLDVALPRTALGDDISVGAYVGARLGREVVERLVDPLLGGVYAGRADGLSLRATVPALADQVGRHRSLLAAARAAAPPRRPPGAPAPAVFAGIGGGLGRLAEAVAAAAVGAGVTVRTSVMVRALDALPGGRWRLVTGAARAPEPVEADAVVLGVPARPASRLLRGVAPAAAAELAAIDYASMALVALVLDRDGLPPLPGSGYLVPAVEGRATKAVTFLSAKWPWLGERAGHLSVVRCSVGRHGDEADVQRDDADLVAACLGELDQAVGAGRLVEARVTRWGGALPQYAVGHRARIARVLEGVAAHPTLAVCGAAYHGVGVPACIRSAYDAVERLAPALAEPLREERATMEP